MSVDDAQKLQQESQKHSSHCERDHVLPHASLHASDHVSHDMLARTTPHLSSLAPRLSDRLPSHSATRKVHTLLLGIVLLIVVIVAVIVVPIASQYDPLAQDVDAINQAPSLAHWLGTDDLGRDIATRVAVAGRIDLALMLEAAILPYIVGCTIGLAAAYVGGLLARIVAIVSDALVAFPFYLLIAVIAMVCGAGSRGIVLTFAIVGWIVYARAINAAAKPLVHTPFIAASRACGASDWHILTRQLLPLVLPQSFVVLANDMVGILMAIVTLGYLGLGIERPTPDWGTMISDGQSVLMTHWWISVSPAVMVVLVALSLVCIADGYNDCVRSWSVTSSV